MAEDFSRSRVRSLVVATFFAGGPIVVPSWGQGTLNNQQGLLRHLEDRYTARFTQWSHEEEARLAAPPAVNQGEPDFIPMARTQDPAEV
jgi:hypothetical protein